MIDNTNPEHRLRAKRDQVRQMLEADLQRLQDLMKEPPKLTEREKKSGPNAFDEMAKALCFSMVLAAILAVVFSFVYLWLK